jgi:hypothetical protein
MQPNFIAKKIDKGPMTFLMVLLAFSIVPAVMSLMYVCNPGPDGLLRTIESIHDAGRRVVGLVMFVPLFFLLCPLFLVVASASYVVTLTLTGKLLTQKTGFGGPRLLGRTRTIDLDQVVSMRGAQRGKRYVLLLADNSRNPELELNLSGFDKTVIAGLHQPLLAVLSKQNVDRNEMTQQVLQQWFSQEDVSSAQQRSA